jgi:hypothetical protein
VNTEDNTDGYLAYLDTRPKREREIHDAALRCNSYSRAACLSAFLGYLDEEYPSEAWRVVTDNWDGCDNLNLYRKQFDQHLRRYRDTRGFPVAEAFKPYDTRARALYDELPETVTVYRGCYAVNVHGLSWTLDRTVAMRFPFYLRYSAPSRKGFEPLLVTGSIRKRDIAWVFLERAEVEIVAPWRSVRVVAKEVITERPRDMEDESRAESDKHARRRVQ